MLDESSILAVAASCSIAVDLAKARHYTHREHQSNPLGKPVFL